jgi:subtilisin family serine protease
MPYSTGRGVVVADINSIVDFSHAALKGHLTGGYDFVAGKAAGSGPLEPIDGLEQSEANMLEQSEANMLEDAGGQWIEQIGLGGVSPAYSHGTLCAGIIAAIAPDSMIVPVRAFDDNGWSDLFTIAKAIRWSVQNGAHVINMSFGTSIDSKAIQNAVEFAKTSKVVLVASAGNSNTSVPHYPSGYAGVISTAATDLEDRKTAFSNYGSTIFVDAPGANIFGPYPGGYYTVASGTSFAAPAVAGTAALISALRKTGIADSIAAAAVNIDSANPKYAGQLGKGRIDVLLAVQPK